MVPNRVLLLAGAVTGTLLMAAAGRAQESSPAVKLPEAVDKAFKSNFPGAEILKLSEEVEEGVTVYDFEFKQGEVEKESDIAADGTLLEWTLVVPADSLPPVAMKSISAAAKSAKLGRCERIEVYYELADKKAVKLAKPELHYAAEMTRGAKQAEVIVNSVGKVLEGPEWVPMVAPKPAAK